MHPRVCALCSLRILVAELLWHVQMTLLFLRQARCGAFLTLDHQLDLSCMLSRDGWFVNV